MLTEWILEDFKAFHGKHTVKLAPLTILCGANSSGKSTLVQSILLAKQTFEFSPEERVIALNGPLVRLGTFSDVLNYDSRQNKELPTVGLGWTREGEKVAKVSSNIPYWTNEDRLITATILFSFDSPSNGVSGTITELQPALAVSSVSAEFQSVDETEHSLRFGIARYSGRGRRIQYSSSALESDAPPSFRITQIDTETKEAAQSSWTDAALVSCAPRHFFPYLPIIRFDRNTSVANSLAADLIGRRARRRTRTTGTPIPSMLRAIIADAVESGLGNPVRSEEVLSSLFLRPEEEELTLELLAIRIRGLPSSTRRAFSASLEGKYKELSEAIYNSLGANKTLGPGRSPKLFEVYDSMESFFRFSVKYLGPLRADPSPLYPLQALASPTDVGSKGELTAAVLHLNRLRRVQTLDPLKFEEGSFSDAVASSDNLGDAVVKWLRYLGVAEDVITSEQGKLGHELRVKTHGLQEFQDLTNVGVGVSQVLPIIVTCLLAEKGSMTVLEQPELHLHPAVQARLADFFIAMLLTDRQVILETHSEHLIERLRLRIVEDMTNRILDCSRIMFFENEGGNVAIRDVNINEFGALPDWPKGFFDQSQIASEHIVLKAIERRRQAAGERRLSGTANRRGEQS